MFVNVYVMPDEEYRGKAEVDVHFTRKRNPFPAHEALGELVRRRLKIEPDDYIFVQDPKMK